MILYFTPGVIFHSWLFWPCRCSSEQRRVEQSRASCSSVMRCAAA